MADEPLFMAVAKDEASRQATIADARATLGQFKKALHELVPEAMACVKFYVPESPGSEDGALLWMMVQGFEHGFCYAAPFELPKELSGIEVGQTLKFFEDDLLDWYILSPNGELSGGYSLRYQRQMLPLERREAYDAYIGVIKYL